MDDVAATLMKAMDKAASGALTLFIFAAVAFLSNLFSNNRPAVALNLFLGMLIGGTIAYRGIKQLQRTIKTLNPKEQAPAKIEPAQTQAVLAQPEQPVAALPAVLDTDPLLANPVPASVTEHTTFHLNRPG